jgi:hypothetical protein
VLPAVTANVCAPPAGTATRLGELHGFAGPPSSEQVTVVAFPVTDQATRAAVRLGLCENVIRGGFAATVQVAVAPSERPADGIDTTDVWAPGAGAGDAVGEEQSAVGAPSTEHVVLVGLPVVVGAKLAGPAVVVVGAEVTVTVGDCGGAGAGAVIVQEYAALADPAVLPAVTENVCPPVPSPLKLVGAVQADAGAPSSEQVIVVGPFVVLQAKVAPVDGVDASGADVSVTVGFAAG